MLKDELIRYLEGNRNVRLNDSGKGYVIWNNLIDVSLDKSKLTGIESVEVNFLEGGLDLIISIDCLNGFNVYDDRIYIGWGKKRRFTWLELDDCNLVIWRENCERQKKAALFGVKEAEDDE